MSTGEFSYSAAQNTNESPFEVFLRYTNEKDASAQQLAAIFSDTGRGARILDIGAGNGEHLDLILRQTAGLIDAHFTLLDRSPHMARCLEEKFASKLPENRLSIRCAAFEDFSTNERYDVVLAAHLFYQIPRENWQRQLERMTDLLQSNGKLAVVARKQDDSYYFKVAFKPRLFGDDFLPITIDDILQRLPPNANYAAQYSAKSELNIPISTRPKDAQAIMSFYLGKPWHEIPSDIQQDALNFVQDRDGIFIQEDGIAVITRV
jgi:cyclopropane fatty-acyl-phospholipid synthase-like methyltransferase